MVTKLKSMKRVNESKSEGHLRRGNKDRIIQLSVQKYRLPSIVFYKRGPRKHLK